MDLETFSYLAELWENFSNNIEQQEFTQESREKEKSLIFD